MANIIVEKFHRNGRGFIIIEWQNDAGLIHEETFEVKKISERNLSNINTNDALTQAKTSIEGGIASRTI